MNPTNSADESARNSSPDPISESAKRSEPSPTELPPEGAEVLEAEAIEIAVPPPETASAPALESSETAGLELDKTLFEEGDPADLLHFAPEEGAPLSEIDRTADEDALSFGDLTVSNDDAEDKPTVKKKRIVRREKGAGVRSLTAAIIYLVSVICIGVLLGLLIVSVVNDVFAFVKDDSIYEITIEDENMSLEELSEYLYEKGIISYPSVFRIYVELKEDGEITLKEGTYNISPSFNYDKILGALNPAPVRKEVTITFQEGMTVDDIIDLFVSKGIGTRKGFEDVIENYDFDYWFLKDVESTEDRYYRLEGYLYPDTYRFYSDSSEVAALSKLLDNFKKKVPKSYAEQCAELGYTMDEMIIMASLIESECTWVADYEYVSAVFHNRLKSADFNGRLDSDASIQYILRHTTGSRKEKLEDADLKIDSPYNTRIKEGLPPGPICNPSLSAMTAALYPNTDCGYFYFVAQANGYNLYAKTYQGHLNNIKKVEEENEEN
ncbi:MAG: endolytic transglycosylase MltG [Clostridia bacterium]|nr:endolytic transglycosylase MltG [Clostridia bacterium]